MSHGPGVPMLVIVVAQYGSEILAIELANLLDSARRAPVSHDRVRVDRREIDRRLDRLTRAVTVEVAYHGLAAAVASDLRQAADDLRYAAGHAYPIPLTDQIRLPRELAVGVASALRAATEL